MEEARRLARLSHPGIVTVYDVGIQDGNLFVVSAFLEGLDLGRWLKENRPTWIESTRITAALAEALAHAHSRLIVHRDVKPTNIILNVQREPVLVDFGLALDEAQSGASELGIMSGTPSYMSPEQAAGMAHRIDGRTDIYGLGVVLYEMLTGHLPFRGQDLEEIIRQLREDEPQPPRQLAPDLPPDLELACLKALAKQQHDRYSTALDLAQDLRRVLAAASEMPTARQPLSEISPRPSAATPPSRGATTRRPSSRRRSHSAERRQVTLLACGCDLFATAKYLEETDAEDQSNVLRAFQQACEQAVANGEGTIVQCDEHGLLACFGYPVAFEDASYRAAKAGLALRENMKILGEQLRQKHGLELNAWIGIHTGAAVVESSETAISLVGEARNVALRLEDVATPGQIICTDATRRLIETSFQFHEIGRKKLKGVSQEVELFQLEGTRSAEDQRDMDEPETLTPLTGRDHELSLLRDRWSQVRDGEGRSVLLMGEPGLGKSRLVQALKEHLAEESGGRVPVGGGASASTSHRQTLSIVEWRCSPHFTNTSFYPVVRFFERLLGFTRDEAPAARLEKLVHHLGEYRLDRPDVVPLFAVLLSLPLDDRFPALQLSPIREREETFRGLERWLSALATRRPILFICEDLHWADASTLEFVGRLVGEAPTDPILTLLTARTEFQPPWPVTAHQTTLALSRLTHEQAREMILKKSGSALSDSMVERVYQRAGGVPLYLEEFTKILQPADSTPAEAPAKSAASREIPATLQDLIMARVDRIEGEREVAQLAAVLGHEFNHDLLAAVARLDESTLAAEMRHLVQADIIHQRGRPPSCVYTFKHALLEDALYNSMVKSTRQQFHRRIAEVLEAEFGILLVETRPELLAHHFTEAGLPDKAVRYWLQAGLRSRERSAEIEAIGHLTRGLALIPMLPESPERDVLELELLGPLGTAYIAAHGYAAPEVGPVFQRARALCEHVGEPRQWLAMLLGIWEWHTVRGDLRLCLTLAEEGVEFATRLNDPGMLMEASFMVGETMLYRGDFTTAREWFSNAVENYDDRERTRQWADFTGHDAGITCRSNLAIALWHLGYPDQALQVNREMCRLAREIGHPFSLAYALHHTAWLCQYLRLGQETEVAADEQISIATAQGFALWIATGTFYKGEGLLLQDDRAKGLALLLQGLSAFRRTGAEVSLTCLLAVVGQACTQFSRFRDAHEVLDEGLALVEKNDECCQQAELYRLKGELLIAESTGNESAAEDYFQKALATARQQQSKAWTLRAATSLARLWQRQDRIPQARELLSGIYNSYTEGFTTPDLTAARALLDTLT
jgi:class 3 adenylate cyclase/predicted ATPase